MSGKRFYSHNDQNNTWLTGSVNVSIIILLLLFPCGKWGKKCSITLLVILDPFFSLYNALAQLNANVYNARVHVRTKLITITILGFRLVILNSTLVTGMDPQQPHWRAKDDTGSWQFTTGPIRHCGLTITIYQLSLWSRHIGHFMHA